ncbi:MAG: helix-turn-helix transcriptional regulator [Lachnospiraceae bacterium]|nr:helix-turn-helix transcriptional regulator [Lachnospiraceae bacterium]
MKIGTIIVQKRKNLGMSQEQLAEALLVSRSAVAKWESDNGMPDIENLKALSKVLNVSIDELVGNVIENTAEQSKEDTPVQDIPVAMDKFNKYLLQCCRVELSDWNDGFSEGYIIGQDKDFFFYVIPEKKNNLVGCLAKQYITEIEILPAAKKQVDLTRYETFSKEYFIGKQVNVSLNERRFLDGIFGMDMEFREAELLEFSDKQVVLQMKNRLLETKVDFADLLKIETEE